MRWDGLRGHAGGREQWLARACGLLGRIVITTLSTSEQSREDPHAIAIVDGIRERGASSMYSFGTNVDVRSRENLARPDGARRARATCNRSFSLRRLRS